jgi:hypothetical protein
MKSSTRTFGGRGGERVHAVHLHLVVNANGNDVTHGDRPEVNHAKGLPDPQVKCTAHMLGDVPAQGAQTACHGTPSLRLAFLNTLARLEGGGLQLLHLLLRRVVGPLDGLCLGRRVPKSCPQA